jgi:AcrR family transcriptional regulator
MRAIVPARSSGRPRSEQSRKAILSAAYHLLRRSSLSHVSTQQIAGEAGVSTATLYRWWPTKEAVLLDAFFEAIAEKVPYKRSAASPLARLREHALSSARFLKSEDGRVAARLIAAIQDDKDLRHAFFERFFLVRRASARAVVEEAKVAGELPGQTDTEVVLDAIYGPQYFRLLLGHLTIDEAFAAKVFDFAITAAKASGSS